MDSSLVESAAARLHQATESGTPCDPVRDLLGTSTDIEAAYAVQSINTQTAVAAGRRICGRKIGLTSIAVQQQLGVDQPDYGVLYADMEIGDGGVADSTRLLQPRAEAEVALVLERDLDLGEHSFTDIVRSVAFALPAIEIVDSRVAGWDITLVDTIADNASCGLYVVGGRPVRLDRVDLRALTMTMSINDDEVSSGSGAACLGHPLQAARWLADVLCAHGTPLRAGDVVMTGALGPMKPIVAGDRICADLGDLGSVSTELSVPGSEEVV